MNCISRPPRSVLRGGRRAKRFARTRYILLMTLLIFGPWLLIGALAVAVLYFSHTI